MAKSPSLRDVARHAQVSVGTASRALNNKANVLPETRPQVLKAATELGYKLQFRVPSSVSTKMNTIGVVMKRDPGVHQRVDSFNYAILTGVEAECQKLGVTMMFSSIQVDRYSHATNIPPILEEDTIDGLVIIGAVLSDADISAAIPTDVPVVLIDAYDPHQERDSVLIDNYKGAYCAVSYLIAQGHTHIGLIASDGTADEFYGVRERRMAYLKALTDHDIPYTHIQDSDLWHGSGYEATYKMMRQWPEVTAIFSCNDASAVGAVTALNEMGKRVPDDISIIGFDDTDDAVKTIPKLTTMYVDKVLMGALGVRRLYDRATDLHSVPIRTIIGTRLIERDSVKALVNRPLGSQEALAVPDTKKL